MNNALSKRKTILDRWELVNHDDIKEIVDFLKRESEDIKRRFGSNAAFIPSNICNECIDFLYVFYETMRKRNEGVDTCFTDNLFDTMDLVFEESGEPFIFEIGRSSRSSYTEDMDDASYEQIERILEKEDEKEKVRVEEMITEYIKRISEKGSFIYYSGENLLSAKFKHSDVDYKNVKRLVERFVYDGGVAILRYVNPLHDGSVIVNGFISSGESVERISGRELRVIMEKFEPDERKQYYKYQLSFMPLPVSQVPAYRK